MLKMYVKGNGLLIQMDDVCKALIEKVALDVWEPKG